MSIKLVPIQIEVNMREMTSYAGVDVETGGLNHEFTMYIHWLALGKRVRPNASTRQYNPAEGTLRQVAYQLKSWFDFIDEVWNPSVKYHAEKNGVDFETSKLIKWNTANVHHFNTFIKEKIEGGISAETRDIYRLTISQFYDEFCPFLGIRHSMKGLSTYVISLGGKNNDTPSLFTGIVNKDMKTKRVPVGMENPMPSNTFRVINFEEISILNRELPDHVYAFMNFWMLSTGLRIKPTVQMKYPGTDPKNEFLVSPQELEYDYGLTDTFHYFYIYKGETENNKTRRVEVPIQAWETIWNGYMPLLDARLELWRMRFNKRSDEYPDTLWLDAKGRPVTARHLEDAIRITREALQRTNEYNSFPNVTPHWLRHTYACYLIKAYALAHGLELNIINESHLTIIHEYAKEQLGHRSMKTTKRYINTINTHIRKKWLPKISPRLLSDLRSIDAPHIDQEAINEIYREIDFGGTVKSALEEASKGQILH